tara:strand:+ start:287 stop:1465 length:1179 start_codon:yes stop_codon:yes gene_type:complete
MAQTLSKTGITTDGTITAAQITQSIDALTGVQAYDITLSGSFNMVSGSITGQPGVINNLTASYTISSSFADLAANLTMEPSIVVTHITASGNISSSGVITGEGLIISDDASITDDLTVLGQIELGHASDTSLTRASAADVNIEGNIIYRAGGTDVPVTDGGTGVSTLTDGGVLLGSGTGAITAMAVLTDGQMIVGDGSTDPVAESGATLRTSIGVGTTDNVLFANISASGDISASNYTVGGTISGAGFDTLAKEITNTIASRAGGTTNKTLNESQIPNGQVNIIDLSIAGSGGVNATTITLPAVADSVGRHFNLYQQETAESNITLVFTGPSGVLQGMIINSDSNEIIVNRTTITIGVADSDRGDRYDFFCDGTFWYLTFFRQGVAADTTLS